MAGSQMGGLRQQRQQISHHLPQREILIQRLRLPLPRTSQVSTL
jgi:hypothetical protein